MYNQYIRFNRLYKSNGFYNMLIHKYVIYYKFNIRTRAHFQGKYIVKILQILCFFGIQFLKIMQF